MWEEHAINSLRWDGFLRNHFKIRLKAGKRHLWLSGRKNGKILIGPWVGDLEKKNLSDVQCNFSISFLGTPTAVFPELLHTIYFKTPFYFWIELLALKDFVITFFDPSVRNKANILLQSWHIKCNSHQTSWVTSSAY